MKALTKEQAQTIIDFMWTDLDMPEECGERIEAFLDENTKKEEPTLACVIFTDGALPEKAFYLTNGKESVWAKVEE